MVSGVVAWAQGLEEHNGVSGVVGVVQWFLGFHCWS